MVESKFKIWTLSAIFSGIFLCIVCLLFLIISGISDLPLFASIPILLLFLFILIWLVYGELRTKAIKVKINSNNVNVKNFMGMGSGKDYGFKEFDGYRISILPSEYREYEYLYLFIGQKKVIKISQFYHSNYDELKRLLTSKTKNLGEEPFSIIREIKEICSE